MSNVVVITGANRGIGLELCRVFSERGDEVIGVCRTAGAELPSLGVRVVENVDVTDAEGVSRLREALRDDAIDILVNCAGILRRDDLDSLNYEDMLEQFRVNALGPLRITEGLLHNLREGSKVVIVTSRVGSLEDNGSGNNYGYRMSKVAVNMAGVNLMHDLAPRGIAILLVHPGFVGTEMTGGRGIPPRDAAAGILQRTDELDLDTSGSFRHAEGQRLPW